MDAFRIPDRIIGLVIAGGATAYLVGAWRIPPFALGTVPVQSRAFPLGLGALLLVLAAVLVLRPQRSQPAAGDDPEDAGTEPTTARLRAGGPRVEALVLLGGVAAYVALLVPLGFVVSSVLYTVAMSWWFAFRRPVIATLVAVVVAGGSQVALAELLGARLSSGILAPLGL